MTRKPLPVWGWWGCGAARTQHTGYGFHGVTHAPSSGCGYPQSCCRTCWYRRYRTRTWSRTDSSSLCERESGPVRSGGDSGGTTKCRIPRDPAPRCHRKPAISQQSPELTAARPRPPAPGPSRAVPTVRPTPRPALRAGGAAPCKGSSAPPAARRTGRRRDRRGTRPF